MAKLTKRTREPIDKLISDLDSLIIAHRAFFVEWQDARFPATAHLWHPDRRALKEGAAET